MALYDRKNVPTPPDAAGLGQRALDAARGITPGAQPRHAPPISRYGTPSTTPDSNKVYDNATSTYVTPAPVAPPVTPMAPAKADVPIITMTPKPAPPPPPPPVNLDAATIRAEVPRATNPAPVAPPSPAVAPAVRDVRLDATEGQMGGRLNQPGLQQPPTPTPMGLPDTAGYLAAQRRSSLFR